MKSLVTIAWFCLTNSKNLEFREQYNGCHIPLAEPITPLIKNPLKVVTLLPKQWIWDNVNGTNYLTIIHN